ncbi:MAG TPA: ABC transporter permease subunit [Azospirillaceae bacterium]|nr:ABC transporter permease subunit [Azospirillaceae bacterium]
MLDLLSYGDGGWGDEILRGAGVTVMVAVLSFLFGIALGGLGAAGKLSRSRTARGAADVYTTIIRGVPALLIIWLLFFGGSGAVTWVAGLFGYGGRIEVGAFAVGVLAVGTVSGAYSTEVLRGAVQAVPAGQLEAAKALGMPRFLMFRRILVPQTLRYALPGLGNVWQLTLKDTSLVSVASLEELMRMSHLASGATRQPFFFFAVAAALYLLMTTASNAAFARAERHANRGVRRAGA